jgi:hypothetical protein
MLGKVKRVSYTTSQETCLICSNKNFGGKSIIKVNYILPNSVKFFPTLGRIFLLDFSIKR